MMKVLFALVVLSALTLVACSGGSQSETVSAPAPVPAEYAGKSNPLDADSASAGAEVFKANCVSCHGDAGRGDGPAGQALDPKPKDLSKLQAMVGDDYLYWRINTGKEGTAMAAWRGILTEEQIWQLVAFIRTLK